jgi:hypothetical protein
MLTVATAKCGRLAQMRFLRGAIILSVPLLSRFICLCLLGKEGMMYQLYKKCDHAWDKYWCLWWGNKGHILYELQPGFRMLGNNNVVSFFTTTNSVLFFWLNRLIRSYLLAALACSYMVRDSCMLIQKLQYLKLPNTSFWKL